MRDSEIYYWTAADKKVKDLSGKEVLFILILKKIFPYLTILTRYFPFSLLWRDRGFHYKFKEITDKVDRIKAIADTEGFWFDLFSYEREERFLIIYGKFASKKRKGDEKALFAHFEKLFENENSYISMFDEKTVKFFFVRKEQDH